MEPFTVASIRELIEEQFEIRDRREGSRYAKEGRVSRISVEVMEEEQGWIVTAFVQGSNRRPYEVELIIESAPDGGLTLEAFCSCPLEIDCKHSAAVLEIIAVEPGKWLSQNAEPTASLWDMQGYVVGPVTPVSHEPTRSPPSLPSPAQDRRLQEWLDTLARALADPVGTPGMPVTLVERIGYVLKPQSGGITVHPIASRVLKDGGWGRPRSAYWPALLKPDLYRSVGTPADHALARRLALSRKISGALQCR